MATSAAPSAWLPTIESMVERNTATGALRPTGHDYPSDLGSDDAIAVYWQSVARLLGVDATPYLSPEESAALMAAGLDFSASVAAKQAFVQRYRAQLTRFRTAA